MYVRSSHSQHRYAYWTVTEVSSASLYQLNLRNPIAVPLNLTLPASSLKRQADTVTLSAALTFDPITGRLWVCDNVTGDFLSCDPADMICTVEVTAVDILAMMGDPLASIG